jgi:hypothetical protein
MMHEREKSDPAIGAGKPTNKAEASAHAEHGVSDATELVEQRAGAEGNASEQSTHRTQSRERVSQALERVPARSFGGSRRGRPMISQTLVIRIVVFLGLHVGMLVWLLAYLYCNFRPTHRRANLD